MVEMGVIQDYESATPSYICTDGDVMARTKNLQEDQRLRQRLKHLHQDHEETRWALKKERRQVMEARRSTRISSGKSPEVGSIGSRAKSCSPSSLLLSSHFRKPWAFSFSETSFNSVYNDEFDPYQCRRTARNHPRSMRVVRDCVSSSAVTKPTKTNRRVDIMRPATELQNRHRFPIHSGDQDTSSSDFFPSDVSFDYSKCDNDGRKYQRQTKIIRGTSAPPVHQRQRKHFADISRPATASKHKQLTFCMTKDDCKEYDSGARNDVQPTYSHKIDILLEMDRNRNMTSVSEGDLLKMDKPNRQCATDANGISDSTADIETTSTCESRDQNEKERGEDDEEENYILFKGRKIRNYVRPQDRYKHDPFKELRRQKLLHSISLENPVNLNENRGSRVKVDLVFPRAAREIALRRLVEQNRRQMVERRRPVVDNRDLLKRVKEFCQSPPVPC